MMIALSECRPILVMISVIALGAILYKNIESAIAKIPQIIKEMLGGHLYHPPTEVVLIIVSVKNEDSAMTIRLILDLYSSSIDPQKKPSKAIGM